MKNFTQILDDVSKAIDKLPVRVAVTAVKFSKKRFVAQNWNDTGEEPWQPRRRPRRGGAKRQRGAVLVDSGRLKRSIRIIDANKNRIIIGTDVPYAQAHNDGMDAPVTVRAHNRRRGNKSFLVRAHTRMVKLPERRFIGASQALADEIEQMIQQEIENAINK